mgnify:CR=1 FL=1
MREAVLDSARLVGRPIFFSMAIIVLAFIPVFALTGQEGKLFHPLAFTKTFAVLAATIIAITLVPVLCTMLLRGQLRDEEREPADARAARTLQAVARVGAGSPRRHARTGDGRARRRAVSSVRRSAASSCRRCNEGDLLFMPVTDPSVSLDENTDIARRQNAAIMRVPEVEYAVAKVGRADTSTDPSPLNMTGNDRPPETARPVAAGDDARAPAYGDECRRRTAGRHQHLDDADHQSDRYAVDRHPVRGRREDLRLRAARRSKRRRGAWRMFFARCRARRTCIPSR